MNHNKSTNNMRAESLLKTSTQSVISEPTKPSRFLPPNREMSQREGRDRGERRNEPFEDQFSLVRDSKRWHCDLHSLPQHRIASQSEDSMGSPPFVEEGRVMIEGSHIDHLLMVSVDG
jgi:hypothetical protein